LFFIVRRRRLVSREPKSCLADRLVALVAGP